MSGSMSILVAVDGSVSACGAVRWAALDAAARRRPLIIGSAVQAAIPRSPDMHDEDGAIGEQAAVGATAIATATRHRCEAALARAAEIARAVLPPGHEVSTELWEGPPIPLLIERSHAVEAIVLGDRGLGDSPVVGSVTEAVTAHAHCPVVVVRDWTGAETGLGAGPVVVGVDGSKPCEEAIGQAMAQASARRARLVAVHAWSDVPLAGILDEEAPEGGPEGGFDWGSIQQRHDATLAEALAGWQEQFPEVEVERVVVNDRPVRHLLSAAEDAQLMVVGRQGRGGFHGMLVGSTSRALLHTAPCPLMIVRPVGSE